MPENLKEKTNKPDLDSFKKDKIKTLNNFFMKKILISSIISIFLFLLSIGLLIIIISLKDIDSGLRITLISITASFILTTAKTLIDKSVQIISYLIVLLSEEQRGISKNLGIEVDKVEFESNTTKVDLEE